MATADLKTLQRNKDFFTIVEGMGYDLVKFRDYTNVGVDHSFVPLGDIAQVAEYDTRMRYEEEAPAGEIKPVDPSDIADEGIEVTGIDFKKLQKRPPGMPNKGEIDEKLQSY